MEIKNFKLLIAELQDQQMEQSARLSAQRFLLEIVFTNAFRSDVAGLDKLMEELIRLTRVSPTKSGPMTEDDVIELQARSATHLQRFHESVAQRIASGREI